MFPLRHLIACLALVASTLFAAGCQELPNVPPSASFYFSPVSPIYAGQTTVAFNASASQDTDGRIVAYVWDFGDGTGEQRRDGPTITHTFPDTTATCLVITYTVSLVTEDDGGESGFRNQNVAVTELPAPGSAECGGR